MKKYSEEEKEKMIEQWKKSGRSRWTFAREQGINPQTLYKWTAATKEPSGFVELRTGNDPLFPNNREIILEHGETRIRIPLEISEQEMSVVANLWKCLV